MAGSLHHVFPIVAQGAEPALWPLLQDGFLSLPLPFPGTAVWRGMQSRKAIIKLLTRCSAESKRVRFRPLRSIHFAKQPRRSR